MFTMIMLLRNMISNYSSSVRGLKAILSMILGANSNEQYSFYLKDRHRQVVSMIICARSGF